MINQDDYVELIQPDKLPTEKDKSNNEKEIENPKRAFRDYIVNQSTLAMSTKKKYYNLISELLNLYGENPSIEQINEFIVKKCEARQPNTKYAIQYFLKCIGRTVHIADLIKAKVRPTIKEKHFLSKDQIMEIINLLETDEHKAIAMMQISTGARVSEIITLEYRNIKSEEVLNNYQEKIKRYVIKVKGKGDKPRKLYINEEIFKYLIPIIRGYKYGDIYLFLKRGEYTYFGFWTAVETKYKRYWEKLTEASHKLGYHTSTHDLRRSFANIVRLDQKDIVKVTRALGHSSIRQTERYFDDSKEEVADTMLKFQENFTN